MNGREAARGPAFYARRLLTAALRFRVGGGSLGDDWANLNALLGLRREARAFCPLCGRQRTFLQHAGRPRQTCAHCGSRARHRVLTLALRRWREGYCLGSGTILHFAPEPAVAQLLRESASVYLSADIDAIRYDGDLSCDLEHLPVCDNSVDLVVACHVLEHLVGDRRALTEIRRVLRPGGVAVLMVPVTAEKTVEWGSADPQRNDHTRDCGPDYFERYRDAGFEVEHLRTEDFADISRQALWTENGDGSRTSHWVSFCLKQR